MSDIEKLAIPVLTPLILGQNTVLWGHEKRIIATWATLKTIVGEYDDRDTKVVSAEEIRAFVATKKPLPDWRVWVGRYDGKTWSDGARYTHVGFASRLDQALDEKAAGYFAQTTTMFVGQLCIHVFSQMPHQIERHIDCRFSKFLHPVLPAGIRRIPWRTVSRMKDGTAAKLANSMATDGHLQLAVEARFRQP